jgi:hypothetical protein
LKEEALREEARKAEEASSKDPEDRAKEDKAERLGLAEDELRQRKSEKDLAGKKSEGTVISPTEPESRIQPLKNKTNRPSYKPSILANEAKVIVGQDVEASNETKSIAPMLEQHVRIVGSEVGRLLLDAGYSNSTIFEEALKRSIDLLCPSGKVVDGDWDKKGIKEKYAKSAFTYREDKDVYICPAGKQLSQIGKSKDSKGREYSKYGCKECEGCSLRHKCTEGKHGRTIKRYGVDEYKEVMRQVLLQPAAQSKYRQRQAMVEPVFSEIKLIQGLTRFKRRGLKKVRVEFSLHCMAYNLRKAVGKPVLVVFMCCQQEDERKPHKIIVAVMFF